jgi:recombination protein RecA
MSIFKASESPYRDLTVIPTGFSKLDTLIGIGGIPTRKITEISGKYSVGKTTLAQTIVANAQKMGMQCLYADTEFSFEEKYAASLGVDLEKLELCITDHAEKLLEEMETWAKEHENAVIVLDSVGGLLARDEAEKETGARVIGGQAKLVATFTRKMVPILAINNIALIVLNHLVLDVMNGNLHTSGGWKLAYHKSLEIRLSKTTNVIKRGEAIIGREINAKVAKNKLGGMPDNDVSLQMLYGAGFSVAADTLGEAIDKGIIQRKGASFFMDGEKIAHGQDNMRKMLKEDEAFTAKVLERISKLSTIAT